MSISELLIQWYRQHQRELPWRESRDPYRIWVSEIILQQTRVDQGLPYYNRFIMAYPTVSHLAAASQDEVLKMWQGLGYYSRARNMLSAAKEVKERYGGRFPDKYSNLIQLKGIGEYTASAIASIAAAERRPVADGNVVRVVTRLQAIPGDPKQQTARKKIMEWMQDHMTTFDPGEFNQAVMEFGALQCTPRQPDCLQCPLNTFCKAFQQDQVALFPMKAKRAIQRIRHLNFLVIKLRSREDAVYLNKMRSSDIWKGLYTFPFIETKDAVDTLGLLQTNGFRELFQNQEVHFSSGHIVIHHVLSHQKIVAHFFEIIIDKPTNMADDWRFVPRTDLNLYPLPRLMIKYLDLNNW